MTHVCQDGILTNSRLINYKNVFAPFLIFTHGTKGNYTPLAFYIQWETII